MIRLSLLLLILSLVACNAPAAVPAPATAVAQPPPATRPAATALPTAIPAPPSTTPIPSATPTATPAASATPSQTPGPTMTPTPTATETPTPTPTSVFACRPREAVAAARSPYAVKPGPWPRPPATPGELFVGSGATNVIHLGFDVEGSPEPLRELLDILDRRGVRTTMFILGVWADTYPDWVRELARRGHEMANHAYSHQNLKDVPADQILAELERTEAVVQSLTGQTTRPWFRPPFGSRSDAVLETAYAAGWTTVVWTGSAEDWREDTSADIMCQTMREGSYPGAILYAHTNHPEMPETIDRYIGEMQARGYTFVPMSVIMSDDPGAWLTAP